MARLKKYTYFKNELIRLRKRLNNEYLINIIDYHTRSYGNGKISKHNIVPIEYKNKHVSGDILETLKKIDDDIFHLIYMSLPKYTGKERTGDSYGDYLSQIKNFLIEIKRILKEGRVLAIHIPRMIDRASDDKYKDVAYPIQYDIYNILTMMSLKAFSWYTKINQSEWI